MRSAIRVISSFFVTVRGPSPGFGRDAGLRGGAGPGSGLPSARGVRRRCARKSKRQRARRERFELPRATRGFEPRSIPGHSAVGPCHRILRTSESEEVKGPGARAFRAPPARASYDGSAVRTSLRPGTPRARPTRKAPGPRGPRRTEGNETERSARDSKRKHETKGLAVARSSIPDPLEIRRVKYDPKTSIEEKDRVATEMGSRGRKADALVPLRRPPPQAGSERNPRLGDRRGRVLVPRGVEAHGRRGHGGAVARACGEAAERKERWYDAHKCSTRLAMPRRSIASRRTSPATRWRCRPTRRRPRRALRPARRRWTERSSPAASLAPLA